MMDTEFEYVTRTYTKCNYIKSYKYDKSDLKYSISDEDFISKSEKGSQTDIVFTINSSDRFQYNTEYQQHHMTHEVNHIQVEEPKLLRQHAFVDPLSEDNATKKSRTAVPPKAQQDTLQNGTKKEDKPPCMDWNDYHRLDTIYDFLEELDSDFPSICTVGVIGTSLEGRQLKVLKVSNSDASNRAVWMDAGIHAREWIAPAVATYVANHIVRNFDTLPNSITNKDWYFHPVVNPDGYEHSHTRDRMWRKNRAKHKGACVGVDLNRNFSYGWGGKESSGNPLNAFYRGPEPFSEPESRAIRDFISNSGIPFKVYITLHSYGQVILFPFAYMDEPCPGYMRLLEGATVMSKAIYESNGNTYKVGISRDVMYGAAGTSNDWCHGEAHIPYCYLIELRSKKHKFMLPKDEIVETGKEILNCVKALMEFIDGKEKLEEHVERD